MFFCRVCNNIYNITKGSQIKDIDKKDENVEQISLTSTDEENNNKKEKPSDLQKAVYFICENCNNHEIMPKNTLVLRKTKISDTITLTETDNNDIINMDYLPHTRNYKCPNKECESHKDNSKRDAIFKRFYKTYKNKYICTACLTSWY